MANQPQTVSSQTTNATETNQAYSIGKGIRINNLEKNMHPKKFSVEEVSLWLMAIDLKDKVEAFRTAGIDGRILLMLTDRDLEEMGLSDGERKKVARSLKISKKMADSGRLEEMEKEIKTLRQENEHLKTELHQYYCGRDGNSQPMVSPEPPEYDLQRLPPSILPRPLPILSNFQRPKNPSRSTSIKVTMPSVKASRNVIRRKSNDSVNNTKRPAPPSRGSSQEDLLEMHQYYCGRSAPVEEAPVLSHRHEAEIGPLPPNRHRCAPVPAVAVEQRPLPPNRNRWR